MRCYASIFYGLLRLSTACSCKIVKQFFTAHSSTPASSCNTRRRRMPTIDRYYRSSSRATLRRVAASAPACWERLTATAKAGVTRTGVPALEKARNGGRATGRARARLLATARAGVVHGPERRETPKHHQHQHQHQQVRCHATKCIVTCCFCLDRRIDEPLASKLQNSGSGSLDYIHPDGWHNFAHAINSIQRLTLYGQIGGIAVQTRLAAP